MIKKTSHLFFCILKVLTSHGIFLYSLILSFTHPLIATAQFATGEWYKIATTQSGIHRIDANFLKKNGIDISKINPQNIQILGNGGKMLPQANATKRPIENQENAIYVEGEADGKFDAQDFILFYAESPTEIKFNTETQSFSHQINYFADTTYYFLNLNASVKGLRIRNQTEASKGKTISTFDDFFVHEIEQKNLVNSGREWVGEYFGISTEQSFDIKIDGLVTNSPIKITSSLVGASYFNSDMTLKLNNQSLGKQDLSIIGAGKYDLKGIENIKAYTTQADGAINQKLTFSFNKNNQSSSGAYLNYFEIQAKRKLQVYEVQTAVRSVESLANETSTFIISSASNTLKIWDISNTLVPENIQFSLIGTEAQFSARTKDNFKKFILFSDKNVFEPFSFQKISNQNLIALETPNLLIITPKSWKNQAERLAKHRQTYNNLQVAVITTDEVYNEFSSGKPDISAIRDFARYLWQKDKQKLKYLLLFADASFDFKNHNQQPDLIIENYIPAYQSRESLHPIYSFSSDDYFGFFEDSEGEWIESRNGDHTLEIGIGRLPVKTPEEAKTVVDKLIYYDTSQKTLGRWRSKLSFVADDGDFNIHQADADKLSSNAFLLNKNLNLNKVYVDAFPLVSVPNGNISPKANKALTKAVEDGSLIVNYNGHGAESGWTEEKILTIADIQSWRNTSNMPLFLTATCEFGRYDNPSVVSGAELAMLSPKGAAIGLLTTTRPVFANTNYLLNDAFYKAFANPKLRIGDIFRITKNNSLAGEINRNFTLLGDPSMALAYPTDKITLTKINNQKPENQQLKALSKVTIEGEVQNYYTSTKRENFNGKIQISVFDKPSMISTLGQKESKMKYEIFQNQIFEGIAEVKNGVFRATFVVPKDINYQLGKGRIHFYAVSADSTTDALGSFNDVMVGGSEANLLTDTQPPKIDLTVKKNNVVSAIISDENGINISQAGIGHEMLLTLNDTLQVIVNQYFTSTEDYTKGILKYDLGKLPAGRHTIRLKIWDTYNNSTETTFEFIVETSGLEIFEVMNYPNPFANETFFQLKHNRENDDLSIKIELFDALGKKIMVQESTCYGCDSTLNVGMNIEPQNLKNGIYYYQIGVSSQTDLKQAKSGGKLIIWK